MTVVPLKRAVPAAPEPPREHPYVTLSPAARHAFTTMEGRMGELRRMFAGGCTTIAQHARIDALCAEIVAEAQKVRRLAK